MEEKRRKELEVKRDELEDAVSILHSHIFCNEKRLQIEVDIEKREELRQTIANQKKTLGEDFYELLGVEHQLVILDQEGNT